MVLEPISKGRKLFIGITRLPPRSPKNGGKWVEVRIGPYGKGIGNWSLKGAWSKENGRDPRDRKRELQALLVQKTKSPTLEQACESFLSDWASANERGKREYRNLLWNQSLPEFGEKTPFEHFSWEYRYSAGKTTREHMAEYLSRVFAKAPSSAKKQQMVLKGVFENAVDRGWKKDGQNPLLRSVFFFDFPESSFYI